MITLRPSAERLHTRLDWLDSRHTFSFGEHHDARFMGFGAVRVINEDRVAPGQGFGTHPHRDMEIVNISAGLLKRGDAVAYGLEPGREAWVQIARGALTLNGVAMSAGDGAGVTEEPVLAFKSTEGAEVLLFDLG